MAQLFCAPSAAFLTQTTSLLKSSWRIFSICANFTEKSARRSRPSLHSLKWVLWLLYACAWRLGRKERREYHYRRYRCVSSVATKARVRWLPESWCFCFLRMDGGCCFLCAMVLIILWLASVCITLFFFLVKMQDIMWIQVFALCSHVSSICFPSLSHAWTPPLGAFQFLHTAKGKLK